MEVIYLNLDSWGFCQSSQTKRDAGIEQSAPGATVVQQFVLKMALQSAGY